MDENLKVNKTCTNNPDEHCMNIFAEKGDKVKYIASTNDQNDIFDAGKNALKYLEKGQIYTLKATYQYDWLTFVELAEFPGILFYSTDFADVKS